MRMRVLNEAEVRELKDTMGLMIPNLRTFVRSLDSVIDAASGIIVAGQRSNFDIIEVYNALQHWKGPLGKNYAAFAETRKAMYEIAKDYGISTKAPKRAKSSRDTKGMSAQQLEAGMDQIAKRMIPRIKIMAEDAATLLHFAEGITKFGSADVNVLSDMVKKFVELRDEVGLNMFAAFNGIAKRMRQRTALGSGTKALVASREGRKASIMEWIKGQVNL